MALVHTIPGNRAEKNGVIENRSTSIRLKDRRWEHFSSLRDRERWKFVIAYCLGYSSDDETSRMTMK
jgi:hypothetical protein